MVKKGTQQFTAFMFAVAISLTANLYLNIANANPIVAGAIVPYILDDGDVKGDPAAGVQYSSIPVTHGTIVTIRPNSGENYGTTGPVLLNRTTLRGVPDGSIISATPEEGRGVLSTRAQGMPRVEDVAELPYGKGIQIGAENSANNDASSYRRMIVVDQNVVHTEFYEATYIYWPSDHQSVAASNLDGTATWQIKSIWHFLSDDGFGAGNGETDLFAATPIWSNSSLNWTQGFRITGNSQPQSTLDRSSSGVRDPVNNKLWRSTPMYRQLWVKAGPTPGSDAGSDGFYRLSDGGSGLIAQSIYKNNTDFTESGSTTPGFDRYTLPGFVRGHNIPLGMHLFFSDVYVSVGAGAVARVEITDNANYDLSTKYSICTVTSWSDTEVVAEVREGIFYNQSLSGLHLHLHDMDNNYFYLGQIP